MYVDRCSPQDRPLQNENGVKTVLILLINYLCNKFPLNPFNGLCVKEEQIPTFLTQTLAFITLVGYSK